MTKYCTTFCAGGDDNLPLRVVVGGILAFAGNTAFYPDRFADPAEMQAELRTNYLAALDDIRTAEGDDAARLAPVGDAFEARDFDLSLYSGDLYHQNTTGALLASMVLYRTIYDEEVSDIDFARATGWANVDQGTWDSIAATADAMVIPEPGMGLLVLGGLPMLSASPPRSRGRTLDVSSRPDSLGADVRATHPEPARGGFGFLFAPRAVALLAIARNRLETSAGCGRLSQVRANRRPSW